MQAHPTQCQEDGSSGHNVRPLYPSDRPETGPISERTTAVESGLDGELGNPEFQPENDEAQNQLRIQDKRRHPRVHAVCPLQVHYQNGEGMLGEVVNVSLGGLLLRADSWIEPGTEAEVEFELINPSTQVVCGLQLSVSWCEAGSSPDCYWVGCRIVDLPFFSKVWLEEIISGRLTPQS